nr:epithelial membrane protein 1-like isoform X2 [Geotrypetes seraphini]XP_033771011.1 epithelial membrane protein 1-like isoform X2 [Geotrypetes seraphini]XP_033771012.1 epithelial membrane protein 1-like isoform X2 [Geotrypetes seraphini]
MKFFRVVGVAISSFVLLLQLVVITSNHCYYISSVANIGLWRACALITTTSSYPLCASSPFYPEILDVIRAFLVLAVIFSCLAVISGVYSFFCKKVSAALLCSTACSFLSGLFAIIGMGIFTHCIPKFMHGMLLQPSYRRLLPPLSVGLSDPSPEQIPHSYSWAFYLSWLTIPALYLAGIFELVAYKREKKRESRFMHEFLEQATSIPKVATSSASLLAECEASGLM